LGPLKPCSYVRPAVQSNSAEFMTIVVHTEQELIIQIAGQRGTLGIDRYCERLTDRIRAAVLPQHVENTINFFHQPAITPLRIEGKTIIVIFVNIAEQHAK